MSVRVERNGPVTTVILDRPEVRNQFNTGLQQAIGRYLLVDADYFWKYTDNAYDFSTLLNTTLTFPISWHNSKLDGVKRLQHHPTKDGRRGRCRLGSAFTNAVAGRHMRSGVEAGRPQGRASR